MPTRVHVPAARCARGVHDGFALKKRGRGECRAPDAPAASCAHGVASMHTSIHSEPSEITRHSRTQWFTAYTVLSPVIGFLATVVTRIAPQTCRQRRGVRTTRLRRPLQATPVKRAAASTASRPASVTSRAAPLSGTGRRKYTTDLGLRKNRIFLQKGLDTISRSEPVGQISTRLGLEQRITPSAFAVEATADTSAPIRPRAVGQAPGGGGGRKWMLYSAAIATTS